MHERWKQKLDKSRALKQGARFDSPDGVAYDMS